MLNRLAPILLVLFVAGCAKEKTLPLRHLAPAEIPGVNRQGLLGHLNADSLPGGPYSTYVRPGQPMIKTETVTYYQSQPQVYFYQYEYDSLWRLSKKTNTHNSNFAMAQYEYVDGGVKSNGYLWYGLNSDGLISYQLGGGSDMYYYSFNSNRNIINEHHLYSATDYYYDADYNLASSSGWVEAYPGYLHFSSAYEYNTKINTTGNYNRGQYYLGKSSVNLVVYEGDHSPQSHGYDTYNYTYNDSGWVSSMVLTRATIAVDSVLGPIDTTFHMEQRIDYTYYY